SCSGIRTTDPVEAYEHWAGAKPPQDVKVFRAQYWQSAHWTKEYILYLKIKPTESWWREFVEQNSLVEDHEHWSLPADAPEWFKPPESFTMYKFDDAVQDSRFFCDPQSGECYIYEIQL